MKCLGYGGYFLQRAIIKNSRPQEQETTTANFVFFFFKGALEDWTTETLKLLLGVQMKRKFWFFLNLI